MIDHGLFLRREPIPTLLTTDTCRDLLTFRHTQAVETHARWDPGHGGNLVFEDTIFFSLTRRVRHLLLILTVEERKTPFMKLYSVQTEQTELR